ncbi:MAG: zf-HC2 domain-containing protein [Candidatus Marinimicrobia bacterium]|nr:zf-HC2 domain-containing protein [Candidatus Neomarinimicrobiota bacterium]
MDCYSFDKVISDYIESNLSAKQKQEANEHLAQCPACSEKLGDMAQLLDALRTLPKPVTRPDFESRLMARIERQKQQKESPFIHVFHEYSRVISVAAAVLLFVATSLFVYTSVVLPGSPASFPSASIRSVEPAAALPAAAAGVRPEQASGTAEKALPDTNRVKNPDYNSRIMMVNE